MNDLIIIFLFITIFTISLRNIQVAFALILAVDLIIPRAVTLFGILPTREIFMVIAWFSFFYHGIIKKEYKVVSTGIYSAPLLALFLGTLLIFFLSTGESGFGAQTKHIFGLVYYLSYAYIAWIIYNDQEKIKQFYRIILSFSLIMAIYGIICYLTKSNPYLSMLESSASTNLIAGINELRGGLEGRTQSTMRHPITWGATACLMIFLSISRGNYKLKYILPVLLFVNIFLTGSRSVLIAFFLSLIYILIYKKRIKTILFATLLISIILLAIFYFPIFQEYRGFVESTVFFWDDTVSQESEIQGSSVAMRTIQLLGALEMIQNNIFFGLGHGYVSYYSSTFGSHPILLGFESIIFNKLVEGGIIGLLLWLYLFFILFHNIDKYKKQFQINGQVFIIKSCVIFYFIFSLFTGFMETFLYFIVFYVISLKYTVISSEIMQVEETS